MKITLINGSPKQKDSASETILSILKVYLSQPVNEYNWNKTVVSENEVWNVAESDVLVLAFPLYVDSIPSHLLRCMVQVEEFLKSHPTDKKPMVYVILNNGFFEGKQNIPAIEVMEHWSRRCGFIFGQGIGIGGGGMINYIKSVPNEHGPKRNIGLALKEMSENILQEKTGNTHVLEPNYPALAYKLQAEYGWRMMGKKNGLKRGALNKQW